MSGRDATVSIEVTACPYATFEEALAHMNPCDRMVYDWLKIFIDEAIPMNPTQQFMWDDYNAKLQEYIQSSHDDCEANRYSEPSTTPKDPSLRVIINCKGGSSSSSGGGFNSHGKEARVSVNFRALQCQPLPYTLVHNVKQLYSNNRCDEVAITANSQGSSSGLQLTAQGIAQAALGFTVNMNAKRVANYQIEFEAITSPPVPDEIMARIEAWDPTKIKYHFADLTYPAQHGWTVYVELLLEDTGDVWWCGWQLGFKTPWPEKTTDSQGAETRQLNAYELFTTHPGDAMPLLNDWVNAVGADGTWRGRVVIYDSLVYPQVADVEWGQYPVGDGLIFPMAPLYLAHPAYVPGVSPGIQLKPSPL